MYVYTKNVNLYLTCIELLYTRALFIVNILQIQIETDTNLSYFWHLKQFIPYILNTSLSITLNSVKKKEI